MKGIVGPLYDLTEWFEWFYWRVYHLTESSSHEM